MKLWKVLSLAATLGLAAVTGTASLAQDATGRIVVAVPSEPDTLDNMATRSAPAAWASLDNIVEPLVAIDPAGKLVPGLADWTVSEDGKVITFTLKPGLTFHNGDPVTSADIVFSHEREIAKNPRYPGRLTFFDHLEVVDDHTVKFIFKESDATFVQSRYLQIVSKAYFDKVGEDEFVAHPIGTGPYKFVDYKVAQYMDLTAFDGYWGGAPAVKNIRIVYAKDDSTRVAMLQSGEADLIMGTPFSRVADLKAAGFKIVSVPAHPSVSIAFSRGNPDSPWADRRARLAIAEAIDTKAIAEGLFQGVPFRFTRLQPGTFGYDPDLKPYPYDPADAKKLLAEAGYPNGFPVTLYYMARVWPGFSETAEVAVLYLRSVGIDAKAEGLDGTTINEMIKKSKDPATAKSNDFMMLYPMSLAALGDPTANISVQYLSTSPFSLYNNPELDQLLNATIHTVDDKARAGKLADVVRFLHEDVATIPMWNNASTFAMKQNLDYTPLQGVIPRMDLKMIVVK